MFDNIESMDRIVMVCGGIGITPMAAILEGLLRSKAAGTFSGEVVFLWATRSVDEMKAFSYLFEQCADASISISIFWTGKAAGDTTQPVTVHVEGGAAPQERSCDPPGCVPAEMPMKEIEGAGDAAASSEPSTAAAATGSGTGIATSITVPNATVTDGRFVLDTAISPAKAGTKTGFMCCGPETMMLDSESFVSDREAAGEEIYFHRETFEW